MNLTLIGVCILCMSLAVHGRSMKRNQRLSRDLEPTWTRHQRPQYISRSGVKPVVHANNAHDESTKRGTNLMETARDYLMSHPESIPSVRRMLADIQDKALYPSDVQETTTFVCPDYGQFPCDDVMPTVVFDQDVMTSRFDSWSQLTDTLIDDDDECTRCVNFWTLLKGLVCTFPGITWPHLRDVIIDWCETTDQLPLELDPLICNGTITIQGEHVYCIVQQADPRHFCESMNNCYPTDPRPGRPPVSERTPWAVKAKLQAAGKWPSENAMPGAGMSKMTPEGDQYIKIAALADIHLQMRHSVGSAVTECKSDVCCLEEFAGQGSARYWGEYTCNLPPHTLQLFLDRVSGIQPDFVLYAGDSPPHTMWDETEESQLNCSHIVVDAMTKSFGPDLRIYPAIGNHEMFPTNLFSTRIGETQRMTQRFTEIWSGPAGFDATNNASFADMSYYSLLVPGHPKLRIVTINTDLDWYTTNFYNTLNDATPENDQHKQWVAETLQLARENSEKVIIIGHHPVGGGNAHVRSARWWEEIVVEYSDVIVLHVSGHTHSDEIKLSFDPVTMEAMTVNHVAPATSSKTYINPSLVMYYLDPTTFTLVDYESFHLEIKDQEQSIGVPPAIAFGYSARDEYNMTDLSPASYRDLVIRFTEDDDLFQKYMQNRNSHSNPNSHCNHACKMSEICHTWFPEVNEAEECQSLAPPEVITTTPPTTTTTGGDGTSTATRALHSTALFFLMTMMLMFIV